MYARELAVRRTLVDLMDASLLAFAQYFAACLAAQFAAVWIQRQQQQQQQQRRRLDGQSSV